MKAYIAGGWFDLLQMLAVKDIETILGLAEIEYFSPRKDNLGTGSLTSDEWEEVFQKNVDMIDECDIVIASTEGKDMGTLFECGYAFAKNKPVVYYAPNIHKFNLMLAKSARAVALTPESLFRMAKNDFPAVDYVGGIE